MMTSSLSLNNNKIIKQITFVIILITTVNGETFTPAKLRLYNAFDRRHINITRGYLETSIDGKSWHRVCADDWKSGDEMEACSLMELKGGLNYHDYFELQIEKYELKGMAKDKALSKESTSKLNHANHSEIVCTSNKHVLLICEANVNNTRIYLEVTDYSGILMLSPSNRSEYNLSVSVRPPNPGSFDYTVTVQTDLSLTLFTTMFGPGQECASYDSVIKPRIGMSDSYVNFTMMTRLLNCEHILVNFVSVSDLKNKNWTFVKIIFFPSSNFLDTGAQKDEEETPKFFDTYAGISVFSLVIISAVGILSSCLVDWEIFFGQVKAGIGRNPK